MDKRAQIRWFIIAVLLTIIAGMFFYPEITRKYLGDIMVYLKPITGYATGAADKAIHAIPT